MDVLKLAPLAFLLCGCQVGYYFKSAYNQLALLNSRVPIEKALESPDVKNEDKRKLKLAQKVKEFAEKNLRLKSSKSYNSYVQLDRAYVTYVVSAAPKWELKHHLWSFPFVGEMPYKGFFNEIDAQKEDELLKNQDLDTFRRGVSAYSTLGWFNDPILSSMFNYKDHVLVNTLIHEMVHATIYIKNSADFNERLAVFLGNKGTELFYLQEEGPTSETLKLTLKENQDDRRFSEFISKEIADLENWYQSHPPKNEEHRRRRLREIQERFQSEILPKLQTLTYSRFVEIDLNNARLLNYKTYLQDLSEFEKNYAEVCQKESESETLKLSGLPLQFACFASYLNSISLQ